MMKNGKFSLTLIFSVSQPRWNGIPFVVNDGANGFLVEPRNSGNMAARIIELAKNEELRTKFGQSGRNKFLAEYSIDRFRINMDNVFGSLNNF